MKIATVIARNLLGLLFLVMGLNGFLHFIPMPPPTGLAGQYFTVMFVSHYMVLVFLLQVIGGALLLANRFVPLALILLGPILVNILLFHSLMAPAGLPLALLATALWGIVFYGVRRAFSGVFVQRVQTEAESRLASDL
jgi:putative oxidoreductase